MRNIDFNVTGSLHLCIDEDKDRRFDGYINNLGWHPDHIRREGRDLYYPEGASVSPSKLCHALANGVDVELNCDITALNEIDADIIVLANGYAAEQLIQNDLPVHPVRGQVSWVRRQAEIDKNICFGGYITPSVKEGFHILGSSFQPWDKNTDVKPEDDKSNIDRYNSICNGNLSAGDVVGGWAALRTSSKDRFPIVGQLNENLYISTAHGSHGIISSLYAARIILAQMGALHCPASQEVLSALSPERFHKR